MTLCKNNGSITNRKLCQGRVSQTDPLFPRPEQSLMSFGSCPSHLCTCCCNFHKCLLLLSQTMAGCRELSEASKINRKSEYREMGGICLCLFIATWAIFQLFNGCSLLPFDRAANLDLCYDLWLLAIRIFVCTTSAVTQNLSLYGLIWSTSTQIPVW
jgi:hypothetical protein